MSYFYYLSKSISEHGDFLWVSLPVQFDDDIILRVGSRTDFRRFISPQSVLAEIAVDANKVMYEGKYAVYDPEENRITYEYAPEYVIYEYLTVRTPSVYSTKRDGINFPALISRSQIESAD